MTSPRSVEMKLGAEKPLKAEEAKRCELKVPMEIKRTTHSRCGGRIPTGAIASRHHVKEERVSTPVRRSEGIRGMKRKDYKEVSSDPKDYGGSDYSDDCNPRLWAAAGREDNDLYYLEVVPKEKTPKGPNGGSNPNCDDDDDGGDPGDVDPFKMHLLCCVACRHSMTELYALVDECCQAMEAMRQHMEDLERVVDDDYKFLN
jgi:hypothetical protein